MHEAERDGTPGVEGSGLMRDRLKSALDPDERVTISIVAGGEVEIADPAGSLLRTPLDGTPVQWTHPNGESLEVRSEWVGGELRQRFSGKGAVREYAYVLWPGGEKMEVRVAIRTERLSRPILYTLVYARESQSPSTPSPAA